MQLELDGESLELTDGGIYDNLGLEPIWRDHAVVLVSDAAPSFAPSRDGGERVDNLRYVVSLLEQATDVRKRWLIASFILGELQGAYWGIGSFPSSYGSGAGYPDDLIAEVISQVRIDLDEFSDAEIAVLENHGVLHGRHRARAPLGGLLGERVAAGAGAAPGVARRAEGPPGARRQSKDEALRARLVSVAEHFDAVVVGSGFGGSVTAYRLAEGGLRVCLLERGKAYPPGSFPRTPYDMARNFWDERGQARDVRPLDVQGSRGARLERARRRLAHLRERADPQGRRMVRQRGRARTGR